MKNLILFLALILLTFSCKEKEVSTMGRGTVSEEDDFTIDLIANDEEE